jgi:hypothetical protein
LVAVLREELKELMELAWPLLTDSALITRARSVDVGEDENTCVLRLLIEELKELIELAWPLLTDSAAAIRA